MPFLRLIEHFVRLNLGINAKSVAMAPMSSWTEWKALQIRDYARVDMRLRADGTPYVIEVNPNPWLDKSAEFAMAARKTKPELSYGDMIEKIVELAMSRPMRERGAVK